MQTKYSVVDIETTGSNRDGQRIIEIAIINFDGNEIEEVWSTLINPERPISYFITNLTGITNEMVSDAPKFYEVAKKIVTMTEGRTFVAHNVFLITASFNENLMNLALVFVEKFFVPAEWPESPSKTWLLIL